MKNKQFFLLFTCLLILSSKGFSQIRLSIAEQKVFQAKVQQTAQKTKTILSDFTQTKHISVLDNDIHAEGKLVFKAPHLVRWEYVKPYLNIAIFKEDQLLVNADGKQQTIDLGSNKMFRSLNSMIVNSIRGDMFDDTQFDLEYFKQDQDYLVKFVPRDKRLKKFMASFELKFSDTTAEVEEVKLVEPNEDFTLIKFHNRKLNTEISDAYFEF